MATAGVFLFEPENAPLLKGGMPKGFVGRGASIASLAFLGIFVAVGIYVGKLALDDGWRFALLSAGAQPHTATFVSKRISESDEGTSYYLEYLWVIDGQTFAREQRVSRGNYRRAGPGTPVPILVADLDPAVARTEGKPKVTALAFAAFFALVCNALLVNLVGKAVRARLLRRRLLDGGRVAYGAVMGVAVEKDSDGDEHLDVRFRFQPPRGAPVDGERRIPKREPLPVVGQRMAALYRDEESWLAL